MLTVKIKKLVPSAVIPTYANKGDSALDLTATSEKISMVRMATVIEYGTGLAFEIPPGYVGLLFPRSSVSDTTLNLANSVGVIDSSFRGEITFRFRETSSVSGKKYKIGDRIGQILIVPYPEVEFEEVAELGVTNRGIKGFGSSGR